MPTTTKITIKNSPVRKVAEKTSLRFHSENYLSKRILISAATEGFTQAAAKTKEIMGFNVVAKDGWIVKMYPNGRVEKISKLEKDNNQPLVLD